MRHFFDTVKTATSQLELCVTKNGESGDHASQNSNAVSAAIGISTFHSPQSSHNSLFRGNSKNRTNDDQEVVPTTEKTQSGIDSSELEQHLPNMPVPGIWEDILKSSTSVGPSEHGMITTADSANQDIPATVAANDAQLPENSDLFCLPASSTQFSRSFWEHFLQMETGALMAGNTVISSPFGNNGTRIPSGQADLYLGSPCAAENSVGNDMFSSTELLPLPPHKSLPCTLFPTMHEDEPLAALYNRAVWQVTRNGTRLTEPKLTDCLMDTAANQFSKELKHYLEPMKHPNRKEEYFASYWLISTLIRVRYLLCCNPEHWCQVRLTNISVYTVVHSSR
jgi:hypothetical protein